MDLTVLNAVGQLIDTHIKTSKSLNSPVLNQHAPEIIAKELKLKEYFSSGFKQTSDLLHFVSVYLDHTNHLSNPNYMGHQVAVPQDLSGIPELIHGSINNPSSLYEMGPAGATCEGFMINWMLDKIGWLNGRDYYDFEFTTGLGSGFLTHGGSLANLSALAAARSVVAPNAWVEGNPNDLVVLGSASAHYSITRALSLLGLGKKAFYPVAVDKNEVILIEDLKKVYEQALNNGKRIMCVVANACATSSGLFDPLDAMGDFCQTNGLWFHVDGAHGASALIGVKSKKYVKGIEKADSVIWDAHKMMRVPSLCTAVLFKDFMHQANAFQQKGSYVFHDNNVIGMDSMPYTIECTKSALGTKLFWSFALEGERAIGDYVDSRFTLAKEFYDCLKQDEDFEVPYIPESNILCFRYLKHTDDDDFQKRLRYSLINQKEYYITSCVFNTKRYLRVVLINPDTTLTHLRSLKKAIKLEAIKLL